MMKLGHFSPVVHKNLCSGYSLEVPQRGTSNEYPQHWFSLSNTKAYLNYHQILLLNFSAGVFREWTYLQGK